MLSGLLVKNLFTLKFSVNSTHLKTKIIAIKYKTNKHICRCYNTND